MELDYQSFFDSIFGQIGKLQIDTSDWELDHIAYQVKTKDQYDSLKSQLMETNKLIHEGQVESIRVGVFRMPEQIAYKNFSTDIFEIFETKPGKIPFEGLEHVEFMIPEGPESLTQKYPKIEWDTSALNRDKYPMLTLKLPGGIRVKFPRQSIVSS